MKLLNDIVDLLMNEAGSLNEALLKTKVLLHQIGQKELVSWVNSELTGYGQAEKLPEYRDIRGRLFGHVSNGVYVHQNRVLAVNHLSRQQLEVLEGGGMRQGLGVIEKLISNTSGGSSLARPLGPEVYALLSKPFSDGYYVQSAWSQIEVSQVRQVLTEVRSRLLDFILELRGEVGTTVLEEDIKQVANNLDIPGMLSRAVFGDNTTIVIGNHNQSHVTNTSIKNDAAALAAELRKHGVSDDDIRTLNAAIVEDPVPTTAGQYGPAVRGWMSRMLGKAVDGSWDVGVAVAGTLLASGLARYYGLPG